MICSSLHIWGDSIFKGVFFDQTRNRYAILRDNCIQRLSSLLSVPIFNHARMGCTAPEAEAALCDEELTPGGLAIIEFGNNDCDMDWPAVAADPNLDHQAKTPMIHFMATLDTLVARVREAGMQPALVIASPLHAQRYFQWVTRQLDKASVLDFLGDVERIYRWHEYYAAAVSDTAERLGCPLINLRKAFISHPRYDTLLCVDGIHPNAQGHELMHETLSTQLAAFLPG